MVERQYHKSLIDLRGTTFKFLLLLKTSTSRPNLKSLHTSSISRALDSRSRSCRCDSCVYSTAFLTCARSLFSSIFTASQFAKLTYYINPSVVGANPTISVANGDVAQLVEQWNVSEIALLTYAV